MTRYQALHTPQAPYPVSEPGFFISFEGIDGAGKSTHLQRLTQALMDQGYAVHATREPGGPPVSEQLRQLILHHALDPLTETLLLFAARQEHVQQRILPALREGKIVLCDRFTDASFAYQGAGRGVDQALLQQLARGISIEPQLTLWFDLPVSLALQRSQTRAARAAHALDQMSQVGQVGQMSQMSQMDRFEQENLAFFERVHQAYVDRAQEAPQRIVRIDANQDLDKVYDDVSQTVFKALALAIDLGTAMTHPQ
jgi:dTMP kinase